MSYHILIIGGGSIGNKHAQICKSVVPSAVVTLCKVTGSAVEIRNPFVDHYVFGVEEALRCQPQAVIIASPATFHLEHIFQFLKLTPHILVEKPLCWRLSEVEQLSARELKLLDKIQVGYVLRFAPCLTELSKSIKTEDAGRVLFANVWAGQHLSAWRPNQEVGKTVSANRSLGGGVLAELSHEIDYTLFLFGSPELYAGVVRRLTSLTNDVPDYASIQMQHETYSISMQLDFMRHSPSLGIEVVCEQGQFACDFANLTGRRYGEDTLCWTPFKSNGIISEFNDLYRWQLDFFLAQSFPDYKPKFRSCWVDATPAYGADAIAVVEIVTSLMEEKTL